MAGYFDSTDFVNPMRATAGAEHGRFEPPNPHTCDACLTPFANGVQLLEHARAAGHLPFRCKCGMFLSRKDALERHVKSMAPVSSERCPQCSKSFKRWDHVEQHLKAYHKVPHQFLCQFRRSRTAAAALAQGPVNAAHSRPYEMPLVGGHFDIPLPLPGGSYNMFSFGSSFNMSPFGGPFDVPHFAGSDMMSPAGASFNILPVNGGVMSSAGFEDVQGEDREVDV